MSGSKKKLCQLMFSISEATECFLFKVKGFPRKIKLSMQSQPDVTVILLKD